MKIQIKGFVFAGLAAAIFAGNAMAAGDTIVTSKAYVDQKLGLKANSADLATVARTGDYDDLTNKPSIPAAQVNADWNASSGVAQILNKPTIPTVPTNVSAFTNDAGYITSTDVPAQVNADWNAVSGAAQILNKPTTLAGYGITDAATSAQGAKADTAVQPGSLAAVATSGSYNDLSNKPTIPAAQVNADWDAVSGVAQILNKPELGTMASEDASEYIKAENMASVATTGSYNDLSDKPSIPAAQVNADWSANSGVAQILNKPNLATVATSGAYSDLSGTPTLATVATSGSYNDLENKPTIPAAQVQTDWNATTGMGAILNKPTLATVATSGSYNDLENKPTIPAAQVNADWNASSGVAQILNKPTLGTAAAADTSAFATAAQGALAETAIQPGSCTENEPCALVNNAWVRIAQAGDQ